MKAPPCFDTDIGQMTDTPTQPHETDKPTWTFIASGSEWLCCVLARLPKTPATMAPATRTMVASPMTCRFFHHGVVVTVVMVIS